jgi:hypothetical protein
MWGNGKRLALVAYRSSRKDQVLASAIRLNSLVSADRAEPDYLGLDAVKLPADCFQIIRKYHKPWRYLTIELEGVLKNIPLA